MKTKLLLLLLLANFSIYAQYTAIPDINFENKLISLGIDSGNPDGQILTANAATVTSLDLINNSISDLTGIEAFVMLNNFTCRKNQITSINLSQNTKLVYLTLSENKLGSLDLTANVLLENVDCRKNQITTINVAQNTKLTSLNVGNNNLTSLDITSNVLLEGFDCQRNLLTNLNVSNNTKLIYLTAMNNQLSVLNVSANTVLEQLVISTNNITNLNIDNNLALKYLNCGNNQLSALNVSENTSLTNLFCFSNKITSLNVSKNTLLDFFMCNDNLLTSIDVSKNSKLSLFDCGDNMLSGIDISNNPKINELNCKNSQLTYLNLKNGNNGILDLTFSDFTSNPDLTCIQVDDVAYSEANWSTIKDVTASYSSTCETLSVEDSVFAKAIIYPNPTNGEVNIDNINIEKATVYNTSGQLVKTFSLNSNNRNSTINLSGLRKGTYYIYLINQDAATAKKIIVE